MTEYKIENLNDILDFITEENIDRFIEDFKIALKSYAIMKENLMSILPGEFEGHRPSSILQVNWDWTDDGKPGITETRIDIINEDDSR